MLCINVDWMEIKRWGSSYSSCRDAKFCVSWVIIGIKNAHIRENVCPDGQKFKQILNKLLQIRFVWICIKFVWISPSEARSLMCKPCDYAKNHFLASLRLSVGFGALRWQYTIGDARFCVSTCHLVANSLRTYIPLIRINRPTDKRVRLRSEVSDSSVFF